MDSAVLTRSRKGNKSIFQAIKQTDTTTEYTLGADGCNRTKSLHRHFQRKIKKIPFWSWFPPCIETSLITEK